MDHLRRNLSDRKNSMYLGIFHAPAFAAESTSVIKGETSMELMVPIVNKDSIPLYEQIYNYIKEEIRAGRLRAGSRLPSTRTLGRISM